MWISCPGVRRDQSGKCPDSVFTLAKLERGNCRSLWLLSQPQARSCFLLHDLTSLARSASEGREERTGLRDGTRHRVSDVRLFRPLLF